MGIILLGEPAALASPCAWYAPIYKDLLEVWREVLRIFQPVISRKNVQERRIEFVTGGSLDFWSLDNPDAGRGRKYFRIIVDEAAQVANLLDVWFLTLRATLADMRGDAWFLSTPRGRNGFWQMFNMGQDPERDDWRSWTIPTMANPHILPAEVDAMRQEMPELRYRQEVLAAFLDDNNGVFRNVAAAVGVEPLARPADGNTYVFGVDWGKLNDFTVITVVELETGHVVAIDRFNQIDYNFQLARLESLYHTFRPVSIIAESNSMGEALIDNLYQRGLPVRPFKTTNSTKDAIIQALSIAFERGEIGIPNDPALINELQSFEADRLPSGLMRYSAPAGMHDDMVMSLALAWQGVAIGQSEFTANPFYE